MASFPPQMPSAPPMDPVSGYEFTNFNSDNIVTPPAYPMPDRPHPDQRPQIQMPLMTDEMVEGALAAFVADHCCYGNGPLKEMRLRSIEPSCTYHYALETYTEKRETTWKSEAYDGGHVDGPMMGLAPGPWDLVVFNNLELFIDRRKTVRVPHTDSIKPCSQCDGNGKLPCRRCVRVGKIQCDRCAPSRRHREPYCTCGESDEAEAPCPYHCTNCAGTGFVQCPSCIGVGTTSCTNCRGRGMLKFYIELKATRTNHKDQFHWSQARQSGLPAEVASSGGGFQVFVEEAPRLWPLAVFPEPQICTASNNLIQSHANLYQAEKIILQRHSVRAVPVSTVVATYRDDDLTFSVFGTDNRVHFPDYPSQCCGCCCTIL